jgi:hypothetical protein
VAGFVLALLLKEIPLSTASGETSRAVGVEGPDGEVVAPEAMFVEF